LRGKTLDDALLAVRSAGLTATVRGANVNADKNVVADQMPDAGGAVSPGTTVTIVVGTGSTTIPDVGDTPREQAIKTLQSNSFHVIVRERRDPRTPAGNAIDTRPAANTVVPRNSDVELTISLGR
jgi:beta-lactam-binding protein with PASTA domain